MRRLLGMFGEKDIKRKGERMTKTEAIRQIEDLIAYFEDRIELERRVFFDRE